MARRKLIFVLLVVKVFILSILGVQGHGKGVLVGWTGDGKTTFCNRYDSTHNCGKEGVNGIATTSVPFVGADFIDTPGFGENRINDLGAAGSSLQAIKKTLQGVDGKLINALIWMVPCCEVNTKGEAVEFMHYFHDLMGKNIPIVAIFNPAHDANQCVKKEDDFMKFAYERGLPIQQIIHFKKFNVAEFKRQYSKEYQVILPPDYEEILDGNDPKKIKSKLDEYRRQQCSQLPEALKDLRKEQQDTISKIREESSVPTCEVKDLNEADLEKPRMRNCQEEKCIERQVAKSNYVFFSVAKVYCAKTEIVTDQGCVLTNKAEADLFAARMQLAKDNTEISKQTCARNRIDAIKKLNEANSHYTSQIENCKLLEASIQAQLNTCFDITKDSKSDTTKDSKPDEL